MMSYKQKVVFIFSGLLCSLITFGILLCCLLLFIPLILEVKNTSYLRLDPTIIVAVMSSDRSRLLLARGRRHIPKMWSCVAGFMEPG